MKRIATLLVLLFISFGLVAVELSTEAFKLTLNKEGLSTFYFTPSEIIEFVSSEDENTVAYADVSVFWKVYVDTGFTLSLEAKAINDNSAADSFCLLRNDGIGLNYLIQVGEITKGSSQKQTPLTKDERTIEIVNNTGSETLPVSGSRDVQLTIPWPTSQQDVPVNGVYQGYLILTFTTKE